MPVQSTLLQRTCACGGTPGPTGECAACRQKREAATLQRLASHAAVSPVAPPIVQEVLRSPGQPLDTTTQSYMEQRLGHDFSRVHTGAYAMATPAHHPYIGVAHSPLEREAEQVAGQMSHSGEPELSKQASGRPPVHFSQVRIHTDAHAAKSAQAVNALAYTVGSHIVFAPGQYAPRTLSGQQLLAHELTHVMQQNSNLHRCPDPATEQQFDQRSAGIRSHAAYTNSALPAAARRKADEIITLARSRDNCLYYLEKLELLFNTPDAPATNTAANTQQMVREAAVAEQTRLATPEGQRLTGVEEAMVTAAGRIWTRRRGEDNKIFYVDNSDPNNIVVRARVRLQRRGHGTTQAVSDIRSLEDGIEKVGSTSGYTLNLEFVNTNGPDVFTVGVDTSQWTTSGNWVGRARSLAHELHHLLGLDDRYNYIESHAGNARMQMATRLHWFRVQMDRTDDPLIGESLMGRGRRMLDDDVCRVAGLDLTTCVAARQTRRTELNGFRGRAFARVFSVYETLIGIRPPSPFDRPGEPSRNELEQRRTQLVAQQIFGQPMPLTDLQNRVRSMRDFLTPSTAVEMAPATDPTCQSELAYTSTAPPQFRLCPPFLTTAPEQQRRQMIRKAALLAGAQNDTPCAATACDTACGEPNSADTWAQFIECAR